MRGYVLAYSVPRTGEPLIDIRRKGGGGGVLSRSEGILISAFAVYGVGTFLVVDWSLETNKLTVCRFVLFKRSDTFVRYVAVVFGMHELYGPELADKAHTRQEKSLQSVY